MRIARLLVAECASPVLALECDGCLYDVAVLEARWGARHGELGGDFHARVFAAAGAGLGELDARLRSGDRPTDARLLPGEYVPLAPVDTNRAAYFQLAPYAHPSEVPCYRLGDARALIGDAQPVPLPHGAAEPRLEVGLAAVLGEELERASAAEAERAIAGYTLLFDWTDRDRWDAPSDAPDAPSQLGPVLATRASLSRLSDRAVTLALEGRRIDAGRAGDWRYAPAESIAYLSQHHLLRPGDVVGLGCLRGGAITLRCGERVAAMLDGVMTLHGWAVRGVEPGPWRRTATPA